MRYTTTAAVLATLTLTQSALAGSVHHRHAHDKRAPAPSPAPVPAPGLEDVDWSKVAYTFSKCQKFGDWGQADCDEGDSVPAPTSAPEPVKANNNVAGTEKGGSDIVVEKPAEQKPKDNNNNNNGGSKHTPAKVPTYEPSKGGSKGGIDGITASIFQKLGAKSVASNGMINSQSGEYSMDLVNAAGEELGFYCWPGSSGWNIAVDSPIYAASIPSGKTHTIYMGTSSSKIACAALHSDGRMDSTNGIPVETQIEFTMCESTTDSTFDVSQLETSSGHHVTMQSSMCTAESNGKCSYYCANGAPCGYVPGEAFVKDCTGPGTTGNSGATDGGCSVGDGKHVKVTFQ